MMAIVILPLNVCAGCTTRVREHSAPKGPARGYVTSIGAHGMFLQACTASRCSELCSQVPDVLLDELDEGPGAETTSSFPGSETASSFDSLLATGSRGGHKTRHASTTGAHMLQPLPQMGRERRSHSRSSFIGGDRRRSKDGILS
jgi:hypothetical protein